MKGQKGFTLIELLVVIAIIAILAAVVLVALGNARGDARDSSRKADMNSMMTAIELWINHNGSAPAGAAVCADDVLYDSDSGNNDLCDTYALGTYISSMPTDPTDDATYYYRAASSGSDYYVSAALENSDTDYFTCSNGSCFETDDAPSL